jgi:exonuclease SbcC
VSPPGLRTITISDFRSIRGTVAIPLNAPVILLHGTNGAGKSTVMSALELALTGRVSGVDAPGKEHLVHRGAPKASVQLSAIDNTVNFTIEGTTIVGNPLLDADDQRFFEERCYLQQRTLGRLLELYEKPLDDGESALTAFVNELLGLDALHALIDGLYPVTDKRRAKRLVPEYAELEDGLERRRRRILTMARELDGLSKEAADTRARVRDLFAALQTPPALENDLDGAYEWLERTGAEDDGALVRLSGARRELTALASRLDAGAKTPAADEVVRLEAAASAASADADAWRTSHGAAFETSLERLRDVLPGVPTSTGAADPAAVRTTALELTEGERDGLTAVLSRDDLARTESERLDRALAEAQRRLEGLDQQLAAPDTATSTEELGKVLASLLPHIHTEECPVCGRDYSEVSQEPLSAHIAARVSDLSAQAQRLQELAQARLQALADIRGLEGERRTSSQGRLEPDRRVDIQARLALLQDSQHRLVELEDGVAQGAALLRRETEASRDLASVRDRDRVFADLRTALDDIAATVGRRSSIPATPLADAIVALTHEVQTDITVLEQRTSGRVQAREALDRLRSMLRAADQLESDVASERAAVASAEEAVTEVERRRSIMRNIRAEAERARVRIVRRVFTQSLNRVWRDLFIRLAPEEPFVPAFRVPEESPRVVATLETIHRDGRPGGSPATMLSAGNLNTAALTLFLALNLSVEPRLPWILLDDPVQSMDEVHVAQFAALLRTLAREHGRRVLIAVHERALFEYLNLELSPASREEGLITVELARARDGGTIVQADFQSYAEDRAFVPA